MRIIAGEKRGMHLFPPPIGAPARPTEDRVKEAVFNILQPIRRGGACLDLFAASGQIGIEFLSRGAGHCVFVEKSRKMAQILERNVEKAGYVEKSQIFIGDFRRQLTRMQGPFDYVYLDPPYKSGMDFAAMFLLRERNLLAESAQVVVECIQEQESDVDGYRCTFDRAYGTKRIRIYEEN